MRFASVFALFLSVGFAVGVPSPAPKKNESKSSGQTAAGSSSLEKNVESSITKEINSDNEELDLLRAKKSPPTTTFCVEIKPGTSESTVVVCDPNKKDQQYVLPTGTSTTTTTNFPIPSGEHHHIPQPIPNYIPDHSSNLPGQQQYYPQEPLIFIPQQPQILPPQFYPGILNPQPQIIFVRDPNCNSHPPNIGSSPWFTNPLQNNISPKSAQPILPGLDQNQELWKMGLNPIGGSQLRSFSGLPFNSPFSNPLDLINLKKGTPTLPNQQQQNQPQYPSQNQPQYPSQNQPEFPSQNQPQYPSQNPPQYPSQNPPQYPSQNPPQYPSQNPPQYPSQNPPQYPSQNPPQYPSQNPPQYPSQNPPQYPSQNPPQYPSQNPPQYPSQNPPQYPSQNPPQYPSQNPPQYPSQNPPQYPSQNPPQYPSHNPGQHQPQGPGFPLGPPESENQYDRPLLIQCNPMIIPLSQEAYSAATGTNEHGNYGPGWNGQQLPGHGTSIGHGLGGLGSYGKPFFRSALGDGQPMVSGGEAVYMPDNHGGALYPKEALGPQTTSSKFQEPQVPNGATTGEISSSSQFNGSPRKVEGEISPSGQQAALAKGGGGGQSMTENSFNLPSEIQGQAKGQNSASEFQNGGGGGGGGVAQGGSEKDQGYQKQLYQGFTQPEQQRQQIQQQATRNGAGNQASGDSSQLLSAEEKMRRMKSAISQDNVVAGGQPFMIPTHASMGSKMSQSKS